ncbi:MAG: anti-sigma factor family protein [Tropicimonas sp.]|uniref:anti-sigma factor family protein n=1 Tax=Tropicimonas sp. TaxID=2067044 RepID=UPI003A876FB9
MTDRPVSEDELHAHVDGALDPTRRAEVSAYLGAHPDVARRIDAYRAERQSLREALAPILDEPLPSELNLRRMLETRRRPFPPPRWAAAAAISLCIGGAGGWALRDMAPAPSAGLMDLGHDAAASYAVYAPDDMRPVEIRAEDRDMFATWAARRLGRPIAIPELAASGYRFMGGRIVATAQGPAALFMYDDDKGNRIVMLARPMPGATEASMASMAMGEVHGFAWSDGGFGYSLVGGMASETLHPLADEARRQIGEQA